MAKRGRILITAQEANELGLVCSFGHVGEWIKKVRKGERYTSRECALCRKADIIKHKYGISLEDLNRMTSEQAGKCAICKQEKELCIDHDHNTGKVRALLCRRCNMMLGWLEETNVDILQAAGDYLKRFDSARSQQCVAGRV